MVSLSIKPIIWKKNMSKIFELPSREGEKPEIGQQPPQLQYSDLGPEKIRLALKS
jgi:hypothetical protein